MDDSEDSEETLEDSISLRSCENDVGPNMNLSGFNLTRCDLSNLDLSNSNLSSANLTGSNLTGTNANHLPYCPLSLPSDYVCISENPSNSAAHQEISYIILGPSIELRGSGQNYYNLTNMDLSGINLSNAYLQLTDFTNTDFTGANIESTNWWYCICPDGTHSEDNAGNTCENNL